MGWRLRRQPPPAVPPTGAGWGGHSAPPAAGRPTATVAQAFGAIVAEKMDSGNATPATASAAAAGTAGGAWRLRAQGVHKLGAAEALELADTWLLRSLTTAPTALAAATSTGSGVEQSAADGDSTDDVSSDDISTVPVGTEGDPQVPAVPVVPVVPVPATPGWPLTAIQIPIPGDEDGDPGASADVSGLVATRSAMVRQLRMLQPSAMPAGGRVAAAGTTAVPAEGALNVAADGAAAAVALSMPAAAAIAPGDVPTANTAANTASNMAANTAAPDQKAAIKPGTLDAIDGRSARALASAVRSPEAPTPAPVAAVTAETPSAASPAAAAPAVTPHVVATPHTVAPGALAVDQTTGTPAPSAAAGVQFVDNAGSGAHPDSGGSAPGGEERHPSGASTRLAAAVAAASERPASAEGVAAFTVPGATPATAASPAAASAVETHGAAARPAIGPENVDRIVQTMHVSTRAGVMEATVRLRPEYLGDVTIQLRVDGSGVSAVVHAETPAVRQWLESQEQTIRSGLAEHGLELDQFIIDPDGQPDARRDPEQQAETQRRAWRRQQVANTRFEITV